MRKFHWAVIAGVCSCGLLLSTTVGGQEADPPEVEGATPVPSESAATGTPRHESYGAKTGLRIFERDNPKDTASTSLPSEQPIANLTEEAQDWVGALAGLWKQWQEGELGRDSKSRGGENRRFFVSRAFIRQHDADRSGELSCDEAPENLEEALARMDTDHDGQLSRAELRRHLRVARRPSAEPAETVSVWMLQTDSGRMKKESLQQAYAQLRHLDQNDDGKIDEGAPASKAEPRLNVRQTASRGLFGRRR
jgi:hypothetical protein